MAKRVHVYDADGEYRVHPPLQELDGGAGDVLMVKNNTQEDLVMFVGPKAFNADSVVLLVPAGKQKQLTAISQGGAGTSNLYAYQVIAPKSGKKAKGNSDPVLIIEN